MKRDFKSVLSVLETESLNIFPMVTHEEISRAGAVEDEGKPCPYHTASKPPRKSY